MALNQKQLKCIEYMVYSDKNFKQIAAEIEVNNNTITHWLKLDEFQAELRKEMDSGFKQLALKARRKLDTLMTSTNDGVALGACKEVLNKAGYQETQKVESTTVTTIKVDVVDEP